MRSRTNIPNQRAIVDRRSLADRLAALDNDDKVELRGGATILLKLALGDGRVEIARRLEEKPYQGSEIASAYAFLTDQILRLVYDFTVTRLYPLSNPTASARLPLVALGGYGR